MRYTMKSPRTGRENTMDLPCTEEQFKAALASYNAGALLQNAFSFLSPEQREFVKTGYTPDDWKAMFPEEPDDGQRVACKLCKKLMHPKYIEFQGMCDHCWDIATD